MIYLYLWNDLDLFINNSEIISLAQKLMEKITTCPNEKVKYKLFNGSEYLKWVNSVNDKSENKIAIGTRPHIILERLKIKHSQLKITRQHLKNGKSSIIPTKISDTIKKVFPKNKKISIYEDISVCGTTILELKRITDSLSLEAKNISINIFCMNNNTLKKLTSETNFNFQIHNIMEGIPIKNSTFLCLSDLINGYIGERKYIDCKDLLEKFFPDNFDKLSAAIHQLIERINNG